MTKPKWYHYLLAASSQDPDNPSARVHSPLEEAKAYAANDKSKITDIQNDQNKQDIKSGVARATTAALALSPLKNVAWKVMTHPVVETIGTGTGLYNLATDQGITKTVNHLKNAEYGKAALSALGDALDASPILGIGKAGYTALRNGDNVVKTLFDNLPITKFKRIFSKNNRAKHAFVTINPFGYQNPVRRGVKWLSNVLADRPIDLNKATIDIREFSPAFDEVSSFWNKNREDAWRLYNGLEQKYDTYIKNADGTYHYNLPVIMERRPTGAIDFRQSSNNHGFDDLGMNHGGLTGHSVIPMENGKFVHFIEDVWDLHPFNRLGDNFSARYLTPISKGIRYAADKTYTSLFNLGDNTFNILKTLGVPNAYKAKRVIVDNPIMRGLNRTRYMNNLSVPKFDKWLANIEAGKIIGGTPFTMKTRVPTKLQVADDGSLNLIEMFDDDVDYILPKEPIQLKFNFDNIINNAE